MLGILLTFLVFNIMLAGNRDPQLNSGTTIPLIYPYFFVNLETHGVGGVAKWVAILLSAFVAVGFVFLGLDKLTKKSLRNKDS